MSEIDWASISDAVYVARYQKAKRRRDGRANRHRAIAHHWFDKIWKQGIMTRTEAYRWLAVQLRVPEGDCHMGMMTKDECLTVVERSKELLGRGYKRGDLSFGDQAPRYCPKAALAHAWFEPQNRGAGVGAAPE